ncbi:uncharacterized protein [Ptychodera flava]|uniref:uncharacterized protein n=1 Tax=Ptychodera flava TaxID=63121 RepID=UPI003969CB3B
MPKPNYDRTSLRKFYDNIENHIRELENLDITVDKYAVMLERAIWIKLPKKIIAVFNEHYGDKSWEIDELREALWRHILYVDEETESTETPIATATFFANAETNAKGRQASKPKKPKTCAYCKGPHFHNDCTVVTDRSKRHEIVKRDKLCFNCLGKHKVGDCRSKGKCFRCGRKHHTSLCTTESSHATTGPSPNNQVTDTQTHATGNRGDDKPTSSTQPATQIGVNFARTESNSGKRKMEPGIHKTAEVPITYGPNTINATVLFDEGSDISFITRDLVTKLDMKPQTSDVYRLKRFGDKTANARSFEMVTFALQTRDGPKSMSALIVPEKSISVKNKISRSVLNLPHIKGLKLAHPPSNAESFEISLLIGTDYYWDFIEDDIVRTRPDRRTF